MLVVPAVPTIAERLEAGGAVGRDRVAHRVRRQPLALVGREHAQVAGIEAEHAPRARDRHMGVLGDVCSGAGAVLARGRAAAAASAVSVPTEPPLTSTPSVVSGIPIQPRSQSSTASSTAAAPAPPIQLPANTFTPVPARSASTLSGLLGLPMRAKKRRWLVYWARGRTSSNRKSSASCGSVGPSGHGGTRAADQPGSGTGTGGLPSSPA